MKIQIFDTNIQTLNQIAAEILDETSNDWIGKRVLLKPNLVGPFAPEHGATTHPHLIRAFVEALRDRGAYPLIIDNPGGLTNNLHYIAQVTGITDIARDYFAPLEEPGVERFIPTVNESVLVSPWLFKADFVINMPRFKTHALTGISGALKNMFGIIMGGMKAQLHLSAVSTKRFCQVILDAYQLRVPNLHVMDGLTAMEGNGPTQGRLRRLNKIIVSDNGVVLDMLMATMMGFALKDLDLLTYASTRGLGPMSLEEVEIKGEWQPFADFVKPAPYTLTLRERSRILEAVGYATPVWEGMLCNLCRRCVEICPAGAIKSAPDLVIDSTYCVTCYCCVELCPTGAMQVPDLPTIWGTLL